MTPFGPFRILNQAFGIPITHLTYNLDVIFTWSTLWAAATAGVLGFVFFPLFVNRKLLKRFPPIHEQTRYALSASYTYILERASIFSRALTSNSYAQQEFGASSQAFYQVVGRWTVAFAYLYRATWAVTFTGIIVALVCCATFFGPFSLLSSPLGFSLAPWMLFIDMAFFYAAWISMIVGPITALVIFPRFYNARLLQQVADPLTQRNFPPKSLKARYIRSWICARALTSESYAMRTLGVSSKTLQQAVPEAVSLAYLLIACHQVIAVAFFLILLQAAQAIRAARN